MLGQPRLDTVSTKRLSIILFLNLVGKVTSTTGINQSYVWDAAGTKLKYSAGNTNKVYIGGTEYATNTNNQLAPSRLETEEGFVALRNNWTEGNLLTKYVYYYTVKDHLNNARVIINDDQDAQVVQTNSYSAFGMVAVGPDAAALQYNKYFFLGRETQEGTGWVDLMKRMYNPTTGRFMSVDPMPDIAGQESLSPYQYGWNNPILKSDPNGDCPNCVTGGIGAGIGAILGGGIEAATQIYKNGSVTDWKAVGGAALQGSITGGAAGFTGGASLFVTAAVSGGANVVGGAASRTRQGQKTTGSDVLVDVAVGVGLGAAGKVAGNLVKNAADDLSNASKGRLGEAATEVKYGVQGYKSSGNDVVKTGGKTATGREAEARFDHKMTNIFTGKNITVESKFNTSGLTANQRSVVNQGYQVIVDRTTGQGLGNGVQAATVGAGTGVDAQRNIRRTND